MGGVKKVFKKAFKGVKKVVKGIGKGIKKVASGVWKGVKGVVKGIGKVFGKLGPIGAIAASFILPGIGSMLAGAWTTTGTALAGSTSGFLSAVGKGMQFVGNMAAKAKGLIGGVTNSITETIKGGLEFIGGKVADGANYLFKGAQEFMGVKNPSSIQDVGKWVSDKATNMFKTDASAGQVAGQTNVAGQTAANNVGKTLAENSGSVLEAPKSMVDATTAAGEKAMGVQKLPGGTGFSVDSTIYNQDVAGGVTDFIGKGQAPLNMANQPLNIQYQSALAEGMDPALVNQARMLNASPYDAQMQNIMDNGLVGSGVTPENSTITPAGEAPDVGKMMRPDNKGLSEGNNLLNSIAKAGSSLLGGMAQPNQGYVSSFAPVDPGSHWSQRAGIGGYGASGGTFLTEAQMMQQRSMAQQLEAMG